MRGLSRIARTRTPSYRDSSRRRRNRGSAAGNVVRECRFRDPGLFVPVFPLALELSINYAKTRKQFGRKTGELRMARKEPAGRYGWAETRRTLNYRTLAFAAGGAGRGDVRKLTAASVQYDGGIMNRVVDAAVQIHGGSGYIWESEINRLYPSSTLFEIGADTTEVRNLLIAQVLLRWRPGGWGRM